MENRNSIPLDGQIKPYLSQLIVFFASLRNISEEQNWICQNIVSAFGIYSLTKLFIVSFQSNREKYIAV